jgi:delta-1-pyrroline-5-carboxylate synthetase
MEDVDKVTIGQKSMHGRGGMGAKIDAALGAVKPGSKCNACVVVGGHDLDAIRCTVGKKISPQPKGTLFATPGTQLYELAAKEVEPLVVRSKF